jgi:amino acid transporter
VENNDGGLKRDIGFVGSAFLSFNGVLGAGIFALPAMLQARFGYFSPWVFPLFGLLVLIVAVPFARVAGHHPVSGGPVIYAAAFGPAASFQAGWIYYVARATALAANANVLITYLSTLWAPLSDGAARAATIGLVFAAITAVNVMGVKRSVRFLDALTLLKAAPLLLVAILGLIVARGSIEIPRNIPPLTELEAAALLVLYAFVGFENSVVPAGETARPERTIPRALIATIVGTALLYFLVQLAYVAVMQPGEGGEAPMVAFGIALMGPAGGLLLTAAAIFSLLGNISGGITGTTRTTYALARDGLLPAWFGQVSARFATPANSIMFMGGLIALLALTGSFVWLAVVSTLARMIVYSISVASLPAKEKGTPFAWLMVVAAIAVCAWAALQSAWPSWRILLILIGIGSILYVMARYVNRSRGDTSAHRNQAVSPAQSTPADFARYPGTGKDGTMSNREQNRHDNDALQSGEGNPGLGQDDRDFGAGGQTVTDTQGESSAKDREVSDDPTVPSVGESGGGR